MNTGDHNTKLGLRPMSTIGYRKPFMSKIRMFGLGDQDDRCGTLNEF